MTKEELIRTVQELKSKVKDLEAQVQDISICQTTMVPNLDVDSYTMLRIDGLKGLTITIKLDKNVLTIIRSTSKDKEEKTYSLTPHEKRFVSLLCIMHRLGFRQAAVTLCGKTKCYYYNIVTVITHAFDPGDTYNGTSLLRCFSHISIRNALIQLEFIKAFDEDVIGVKFHSFCDLFL